MRIDNPLLFGSLRTSGSFLWQASGSFTGSFRGDGSNLTGITAQNTISSSNQIQEDISGSFTLVSASFATALNNINYSSLTNVPNNIISSSNQINNTLSGTALSVTASKADQIKITSDTAANNRQILFAQDITLGSRYKDPYVNFNLTYNPSTGRLSSTEFSGDGSNLTNLPFPDQAISGANATLNVITFTRGDGSTFTTTVHTGSAGAGGGVTQYYDLNSIPTDIVSSSAQVTAFLPANTVSSSAQINYNSIQNQPTIPDAADYSASFQNIDVKVVNDGGNKYQIDGVTAPKLTLQKGHTYRFDLSDSSNSGHPFAFRLRNGTTSYTDGIHQNGLPGQIGAYTQIHVKQDAPTQLIYYCTIHGNGMGNSIIVQSGFNTILEDNAIVSGSLNVTGDITAYSTSDERLKANVTPILDGLDKIGEIQGYEYDWIENEHHTNTGHDIGVIAQEIEKIAPEAVTTRDNGYKAVRYEKLVPILIQAIKELNDKVKKLEDVHR